MGNVDNTREELEKILSEREYQIYYEDNRSFIEKLWDTVTGWIMELLEKIFTSLEPASGLADAILFTIIAVLVGLLALTIILWIRSVKRKRRLRDKQPLRSLHELEWTYSQHIKEAEKVESDGNFPKATRHLFLALLLYLHEMNWLEAKIWKTNLDYVEELRTIKKDYAKTFYHIALFFDEVVYGERKINREDYHQYKNQLMELLKEKEKSTVEG